MHKAAREGQIEILEQYEGDLDLIGQVGETILQSAVFGNQVECVRLLMTKGAKPNNVGWIGSSPLCIACKEGYFEIVKILVENGANLDALDLMGNSPISFAIEYTEIFKYLISKGAKIDIPNCIRRSIVFNELGIFKFILWIIAENGESVRKVLEEINKGPKTSLGSLGLVYIACNSDSDLEFLRILLENGLDPNGNDDQKLFRPVFGLFSDIRYRKTSPTAKLELLAEYGADFNLIDPLTEDTAIFKAYDANAFSFIPTLLKFGANPHLSCSQGRTLLNLASMNGLYDLVQTILEYS